MPRYFFDYADDTRVLDRSGTEFPRLADAEHHARIIAAELARDVPDHELHEAFIVVVDSDAKEVFRVALAHLQ
ncbi:DUF6894 family protein [Rhodoplanes sp. SY1]|uniref:DUF6894 family protein n=1 Tax=Rhodoplanes sp. SY1 TaxID=3166646 RepID=UPI0038B60FF9